MDPGDDEPIGYTATKASRTDPAGIGFKKQIRSCSEHIYVSRLADDSIFASSDLCIGDEVVSIDVPVSGMNAVEVAQLVGNSEGYVTIVAARRTCKKSNRLLRRSGVDSDYITATANKQYRTTEAGLGFRRSIRKSRERIVVADIEEDSIFAGTDLALDDEVISVEVGVDGRTANEVADLVRLSEGDITLFVVPQHPASTRRDEHELHYSKGGASSSSSSSSSRWRLGFSRKKHVSPANSSTNTGLTVGTIEE